MTAPQQQSQSLLDLEHTDRSDRRFRGPVTFSDDASLQRRLERRSTDRRRRERAGPVAPAAAGSLEARELCHDLRQPLASAVVLVHMIEREDGLTATARHELALLHAELARLAGMLNSQLEPPPPVLVDLAAVVRAVCGGPADAEGVPLEVLLTEVPLVLGDPVQLSRLVGNLVTNARTAAGPTGRVRVLVDGPGGAARIAVEDSGSAAGAAPSSGFGLGLMIVDSVVQRHGGRSTCAPSELGGLRVCIELPAALPVQDAGVDA